MLTKKDYFTPKNNYLSNSKLNWFDKDKALFKKYFIDGEDRGGMTDPMIIGSAVDTWLTSGKKQFEKDYVFVTRRNKKSDTPWECQLSETMYNEVVDLCETVERQTLYKELKNFDRQVLLTHDMPIGKHFKGICGILDFYKDGIIVDLKTINGNTHPSTYHYKCLDFGYYRQMAMYSLLVEKNYDVSNVECYHMVVQRDGDGIFPVYFYKFSEERIEEAKKEIDDLITALKKEKDFAPRDVAWKDYVEI